MEELGAGGTAVPRLHQLTTADSADVTHSHAVALSVPDESCCSYTHGMDCKDAGGLGCKDTEEADFGIFEADLLRTVITSICDFLQVANHSYRSPVSGKQKEPQC